jgi:hypothetical protein
MASELRVNTLKDANGNNSIATSFVAGGSAKSYGYAQQRTATVELKDSFNMTSWTDDTTGESTWTINANMGNGTYTIISSHSYDATAGDGVVGSNENWVVDATSFKQDTFFGNGTFYDCDYVYAATFGDLA